MSGPNNPGNMKVEMPSTNASGDPETSKIPTVPDDQSTKVKGKTNTPQQTDPVKPQTKK